MSSYKLIEAEKTSFPVQFMCRMLGVSRSGYYAWRSRPPSMRSRQDATLRARIREIHRRSRETYGSPRVHAELRTLGTRCSRKRVERLMREAGLRGCIRSRRKLTTRQNKRAAPAEDLLRRDFAATRVDKVWAADIAYVATGEGFLYVAFILDLHSRRIVGWAGISSEDRARRQAFQMTVWKRDPAPGLVHHSAQYTSVEFGKRLQEAELLASMGSISDAYDNALAEAFVASLKTEILYRHSWTTMESMRVTVFEYIQTFYNSRRRHSALGYLSPMDYEEVTIGEEAVA